LSNFPLTGTIPKEWDQTTDSVVDDAVPLAETLQKQRLQHAKEVGSRILIRASIVTALSSAYPG
jgi:hypothetical protein